ncbi:MAG: glycerophosphodiester phosphodiesterase [Chloroflexi bacterium]|nr:glycerophosphodiester phosphodiesterase [Chloroflexota bacterium]
MAITDLLDHRRPLVIAHRGASGEAPENTMAAFELALEQGADVIEMDVHMTADGYPVVIHDDTLERTTNGKGLVRQRTLAELKGMDAGSWSGRQFAGQKVPTLEEVVAWAKGKVPLAIEVKNVPHRYRGIEASVTGVLERARAMLEHEVFSFDHVAMQRFKTREPGLLTGVCYRGDVVDHVALAKAAGATVLHPWLYDMRSEAIRDAHAAGLLVAPWVADTPEDIRALAALGVDGITTNFPRRAREIIGRA